LVGHSLRFQAGKKPVEDLREIGQQLGQSLAANPALGERLVHFAGQLDQLKEDFDEPAYKALNEELDAWTITAGILCQDIDRQLDLSASLQGIKGAAPEKKRANASI